MAKDLLRDLYLNKQKELEKLTNSPFKTIGDELTTQGNDEGYGFLFNALEFIDAEIHKPMARFFHYRDLPYLYAGGAMELASFYKSYYDVNEDVPYGSGENGTLKTVKVQLQKKSTRVQPFQYKLKLGLIDQLKSEKIGIDYMNMFEEGVLLVHNKLKDQIAYNGLPGLSDSYGLINNPNIATTTSTTAFASIGAMELFNLINEALLNAAIASDLDERFAPDRVLLPTSLFVLLSKPLAIAGVGNDVATTGISLWRYLKDNLARSYATLGGDIDILPLPYLEAAGANSKGRIVIYNFNKDLVRGVVGMELTRGATVIDAADGSINTFYCAFEGEVQFVYEAPIRYIDSAA